MRLFDAAAILRLLRDGRERRTLSLVTFDVESVSRYTTILPLLSSSSAVQLSTQSPQLK